METRVLFVRHGHTAWHSEGKVLGRTDVPLSPEGVAQIERTAACFGSLRIADLVASPLQRAVQSAEIIGSKLGISVARDPRFTDFDVGRWTGMSYQKITNSPEYQRFLADPVAERIPGGENLSDVRERAVAALEQALVDSPRGDAIIVVTHAGIIRVLLSHYLGSSPSNYHRIRVSLGSVSILSFRSVHEPARVLTVNHCSSLEDTW